MGYPRVMLAAPASGSGKTMVTCGILQALVNRGKKTLSFKCGPDYIDPMFHTKVIGAPSRNLDTFFTGMELTRYLFARQARSADISVLEGVMGYYDGVAGITTQASSYELAQAVDAPVILIVNAKGMSLSVVPYIKGFLEYKPDSRIRGVILNQTSPSIYPDLKAKIEQELSLPVYGYVPSVKECVIESRHLGLVTPDEIKNLRERLQKLSEILEETLQLDAIIGLAESAGELSDEMPEALSVFWENWKKETENAQAIFTPRIGVAKDAAFCFYYQDNLELLERLGAELVYFSPLSEKTLPPGLNGLLLGGGYPELYARELSENDSMCASICDAVSDGMPCVAECGGFLYLHTSMEDMEHCSWPMADVIKGHARRTSRLGRFGYIELSANRKQLFGEAGSKIRGHEFHYFDSTQNGDAFHAKKPQRKRSWECIKANGHLAAGFPHLYYYSQPQFAANFIKACRGYRV